MLSSVWQHGTVSKVLLQNQNIPETIPRALRRVMEIDEEIESVTSSSDVDSWADVGSMGDGPLTMINNGKQELPGDWFGQFCNDIN